LGFRREGGEEDGVDALGCGVQKRSRRKNGVDALGFGFQKGNATTKCTFYCD
jgi:hypothetical protein